MTDHTGHAPRTCPYCHSPCDETARCPACNAAHHPDCWSELGGCAVAGCDGRPPTPQAAEEAATQTGSTLPQPPSDSGHTSSQPSPSHQGLPQPPLTQPPSGPQQPGQTGASPGWGTTADQHRPGDWGRAPNRQPPLTADGHPVSGVDVGEFIRKPWVWGTGIAALLLVLILAGGNTTDHGPDRMSTWTSDMERQIEQGLEAHWGFPHTVDCNAPSDLNEGTSFRCFASSSEGPSTIYAQVSDNDGSITWEEDF